MRIVFAFLCLIMLAPVLAKSEKDFRKEAPSIHRRALWLEENPGAETWGDSLKSVLAWGREVPYVTLGTAKVFEKEVQNLPKDPVGGRVATMLRVGYVQYATSEGFEKAKEFDMAKAGLTCMIRFYENVKRDQPDYSIPAMERLAGLYHSDALDGFIEAKLRK